MAEKRITGLDDVDVGLVTGAAVFEVEQPGITAPETRKLTLTQLRALISGPAGGARRVPFLYSSAGGSPYTHVVSAGVTLIDVEAGGGGGGSGHGSGQVANGAGGGYVGTFALTVVAADEITVVVGAGGALNESGNGAAGGDSIVTGPGAENYATAAGGAGGDIGGVAAGGSGTSDDASAVIMAGQDGMGYIPEGDAYPMFGGRGGGPIGGHGGVYVPHSGAGGLGTKIDPTQPGGGAAAGAAGGTAGAEGWVIIWEYQA